MTRDEAEKLRSKSKAATFEDTKRDYEELAVFENLAQHQDWQKKLISPSTDQIAETIPYIERTLVFLGDLRSSLDVIPQVPDRKLSEQLVKQLQDYVQGFERLRSTIRNLNENMNQKQIVPTGPDAEANRSA